jgi:tight adherence protein B
MLLLLIGLLIMMIIFLVCAAYAVWAKTDVPVTERMERYTVFAPLLHYESERSRSLVRPLLLPRVLTACSEFLSGISQVQAVEVKMAQAGLALRGSEFVVLVLGVSLLVSLFSFLLSGGDGLIALLAGGFTAGGMFLWLKEKIRRRWRAFNDQLGDAALMLASALRSGLSFLQALEMVSVETQPPLAAEFSRVLRETQLGVSVDEALQHLLQRLESHDAQLFVSAVVIQREAGGNLATVLDHLAESVRDRLLVAREMHTLTAQGRLSGWVVGAIPFVLAAVLSVLNPGYYDVLFTGSLGYWCAGLAGVSYLLAILMISRITKVDY